MLGKVTKGYQRLHRLSNARKAYLQSFSATELLNSWGLLASGYTHFITIVGMDEISFFKRDLNVWHLQHA